MRSERANRAVADVSSVSVIQHGRGMNLGPKVRTLTKSGVEGTEEILKNKGGEVDDDLSEVK